MLVSQFIYELEQLKHESHTLAAMAVEAQHLFVADQPGPFLTGDPAIALLKHHLTQLYYPDNQQDGRFSPVCIGAVACSQPLMDQVERVNHCKGRLNEQADVLFTHLDQGRALSPAGLAKRKRKVLSDIGQGRLSLNLCYRKIPFAENSIRNIRFSLVSRGRSIRKITPEQAVALLDKKGYDSEKAVIDREVLCNLAPDTNLAQIQCQASYYKMNMVDQYGVKHAHQVFMPVFYPEGEPLAHVQCNLPAKNTRKTVRKIRSDRRIGDVPLASTISVYAYLD